MPGASTTSAVLVSIVTFSGCCFWKCSPENGLNNLEGLESSWELSMAGVSHAVSMAREGASSGPNVIKQSASTSTWSAAKDVVSSLDVRATTLRAETFHRVSAYLHTSRFQGIDEIASPLSIFEYLKLGPLKGGTVHSQLDLLKNVTTPIVEHHRGASSTTSLLAHLCGLAVILDVLLALGCFMLCRRGHSEPAPTGQNSNGVPACLVRPTFAQVKAPVSQECPVFPDDGVAASETLVNTPAPAFVHWEAHSEKDIMPCQLNFADGDDGAAQDEEQVLVPVEPVIEAELAEPEQVSIDNREAETHPVDVSQIPVPEEESVDDNRTVESCPDEELKVRINAIVSARKDQTSRFDVSQVPSPARSGAKQLLAEEQATHTGSWETVGESATNSGSWSAAKKQLLRGAWPSFQQTPGKDRAGLTGKYLGFGSLTPGEGEDVAARKADAFQAWGVPSPEVIGRPAGWKWQ